MMQDPTYTLPDGRKERPGPSRDVPALATMSILELTEHCQREIGIYRKGMPCNEQYIVELLRRATVQHDAEAWLSLQQCLGEIALSWIHGHVYRDAAYRYDTIENYAAQAFERFWMATAYNQRLEFSSLSAALKYLYISLNSVILDTMRAYSRPRELPLPEPGSQAEPAIEDSIDSGELWQILRNLFPDRREQRLIHLFFYCGLKPREIVRYCPREFSDVREVYSLRRNIYDQLLRNAHQLRWRLGSD
ncbi:MAG TPA: hypothetical protein VJ761_08890 [Ktedonobacteraceae bacterium]|nr:hypothetical protein [Ktedonobacteraceae bacterium]